MGRELQAIFDGDQMHMTFFDRHGGELDVETVSLTASANEDQTQLRLLRYGAGHFAAVVDLDPGRWDFAVEGTTNDGHAFDGSFTLDVVE